MSKSANIFFYASDLYYLGYHNKNAIFSTVEPGDEYDSEPDDDEDEAYITVSAPVNHSGVTNSTPGILIPNVKIVPFREYILSADLSLVDGSVGRPFLYAGDLSANLINRFDAMMSSDTNEQLLTARFTMTNPNLDSVYIGALIHDARAGDGFNIYKLALTEVVGIDNPDTGNTTCGFALLETLNASDGNTNTDNTAIGNLCMSNSRNSRRCTSVGAYAMQVGDNLDSNTGIGYSALWKFRGSDVTAVGCYAGSSVVNGSESVFVGFNTCGDTADYMDKVVVVGANSCSYASDLSSTIVVGTNSCTSMMGVSNSVFIGDNVCPELWTATNTIMIGHNAGNQLGNLNGSDCSDNTVVGADALSSANTNENQNTCVGSQSMRMCTSKYACTAVGYNANNVESTTSDTGNTCFGANSAAYDGDYNTSIGPSASISGGDCNSAFGTNSVIINRNYCTAIGCNSGSDIYEDHQICLGTASDAVIIPGIIRPQVAVFTYLVNDADYHITGDYEIYRLLCDRGDGDHTLEIYLPYSTGYRMSPKQILFVNRSIWTVTVKLVNPNGSRIVGEVNGQGIDPGYLKGWTILPDATDFTNARGFATWNVLNAFTGPV